MDELTEALDVLAAQRLDGEFGPALLERLTPLLTAANRLAAEVARTVRQCELAGAAEHDGKASMASWLRGHHRLSQGEAGRLVRSGRALEALPSLAAAASAGAVTAEAVSVVAPVASAENLAAAEAQDVHVAAIDAALAQVAMTRPHAELRQVVGHYLARLDPDGDEPDPTESRSLVTARDSKGMVIGRFALDAIGGEKVLAAVESILQASRPAGDTRTRSQQQADALVQLADNALASGDLPTMRTVKPHVAVVIDLDDLVDPHPGAGAGRTGFGAMISAARTRWLACDSVVSRVVMGPDGQLLDLGRTHRVVPPHLRRAVEIRDRTCVFAGCDAPSHWCDVHHVLEWLAHDGDTSLENSALLCERHHTKVHHGFRVERQPDGRWRTWRPDGTEIVVLPVTGAPPELLRTG
ncbi:protein of unknown function [Blastococcus fimeti]|nr:protein of unknown function [Blastococcus fimeti]